MLWKTICFIGRWQSIWTSINGFNGRYFGNEDNFIFLPAAGYRNTNGIMVNVDTQGGYWNSVPYGTSSYAMHLIFRSGFSTTDLGYKDNEFCVRCVAE